MVALKTEFSLEIFKPGRAAAPPDPQPRTPMITRKELQPFELTSKVTTEFAHNATSRVLHKERYCRIDIISELKCI